MQPRARPTLGGRDGRSRHSVYRQPQLAYQARRPVVLQAVPVVSPTVSVPVTIVASSTGTRHAVKRRHGSFDMVTSQVAKKPLVPSAPGPVEKVQHQQPERPEQVSANQPAPDHHVTADQPKKPWHAWRPRRHHVMYAMACTVFVAGIGVSIQGFLVNRQATDQVNALSSDDKKSALPSEAPLGDKQATKNYRVSGTLPRVITIDKLGVSARVLALDVTDDNQMKTPGNIYDTGWYTGSAKPGEAGASVINGHVSGPTKKGVFYRLKNLSSGDIIQVERGDGTKLRYAVKSVETVAADKVDMVKLLNAAEPGKPGLNLITCGGKFDSKTNHFSDRTVVFASQTN